MLALTLGASLSLALLAPASHSRTGGEPPAARAIQLLRDSRTLDPTGTPTLTAELVSLAPQVITDFADILLARRIPALGDAPEQILSEPQRNLILQAVGAVSPRRVEGEIARLTTGDGGVPGREVAILLLGATGSAGVLDRICALALTEPGVATRLQNAVLWSAEAIVRRDPSALERLERGWPQWTPVLSSLVKAAGAAGDPRALAFLRAVKQRSSPHARLAVSQIQRLGPLVPSSETERFAGSLRADLDPRNAEDCKVAAIALARLGDSRSIPSLMDLLTVEHRGVRDTAHWALRELTGLGFPADPEMWRSWYELETKWHEHERAAIVEDLESASTPVVVAAIRELGRHSLHRHELARELGWLLEDPDERIRLLTCVTLGKLGSPAVLMELLAGLQDSSDAVVQAARGALVQIMKMDLPRDVLECRVALEAYL